MWIFCGLGNPGKEYEETRHNLGFMVVSAFAQRRGLTFEYHRPLEAEIARLKDKCLLVKPMTYMNLSGRAIKKVLEREGLSPSSLLVIYDDMDLPLGRIKFAPKGGSGGHNGLKSIINELGVDTFPRLKLGIGRPPEGLNPKDFVLSPFSYEEKKIIQKVILIAQQALEELLTSDLLKIMTKYNRIVPINGDKL